MLEQSRSYVLSPTTCSGIFVNPSHTMLTSEADQRTSDKLFEKIGLPFFMRILH